MAQSKTVQVSLKEAEHFTDDVAKKNTLKCTVTVTT